MSKQGKQIRDSFFLSFILGIQIKFYTKFDGSRKKRKVIKTDWKNKNHVLLIMLNSDKIKWK